MWNFFIFKFTCIYQKHNTLPLEKLLKKQQKRFFIEPQNGILKRILKIQIDFTIQHLNKFSVNK